MKCQRISFVSGVLNLRVCVCTLTHCLQRAGCIPWDLWEDFRFKFPWYLGPGESAQSGSCFGFFQPQAASWGVFLPVGIMTYQQEQCCLSNDRRLQSHRGMAVPGLLHADTCAGCDPQERRGKRDPGHQALGLRPLGCEF